MDVQIDIRRRKERERHKPDPRRKSRERSVKKVRGGERGEAREE